MKEYMGNAPSHCDICHRPITNTFIDGATRMGPWANMCPRCHHTNGVGLGAGKGQKYEVNAQGKWPKTAG